MMTMTMTIPVTARQPAAATLRPEDLRGKVAVITGAASGTGLALALEAARHHGDRLDVGSCRERLAPDVRLS
jgi:hypothetical protein